MENEKKKKKKSPVWSIAICFIGGIYFIAKEVMTSYDMSNPASWLMIGSGVCFIGAGIASIIHNNKIDKEEKN